MSAENPLHPDHIYYVGMLAVGRVTQTVFEQMLRNAFNYQVIPFGYEYTHPDLAHRDMRKRTSNSNTARISTQPDFKIYPTGEPEKVDLVEVKYRSKLLEDKVCMDASKVRRYWPDAYLFIATTETFYMDSCEAILKNRGSMRLFVDCEVIDQPRPQLTKVVDAYHRILIGALPIKRPRESSDTIDQQVEDPIISIVRKLIQN